MLNAAFSVIFKHSDFSSSHFGILSRSRKTPKVYRVEHRRNQERRRHFQVSTVFENHRKSLIQHCERSELRLHFFLHLTLENISGYLLKNSSGLDQSFKKVSKNSQKNVLKKMAKNSLKKITEKKSLRKITKKIQKNLECFQTVKEFDNYVFSNFIKFI